MQNSQNIPMNNVFFNFVNTSLLHIDYLKKQSSIFSNFAASLIENSQNFKEEIQKHLKVQETNFVIFKPQRGNFIDFLVKTHFIIMILEVVQVKDSEEFQYESIKHLKINENKCLIRKSMKNFNENNSVFTTFETKNLAVDPSFFEIDEQKKAKKLLNGSFEKMTIEENEKKKTNGISIVMETYCENDNENESKSKKSSKTFEASLGNPQGIVKNQEKASDFNKQSLNPKENKSSNRLSMNLSNRLSQIKVDPEKEKRKSIMLDKILAEKSLDEILNSFQRKNSNNNPKVSLTTDNNNEIPNKNNDLGNNTNKIDNKTNIDANLNANNFDNFNEHEEFFSLEHLMESDSMASEEEPNENMNQQKTIANDPIAIISENNQDFEGSGQKDNNYRLTDYSSNESSNDGSYYFQWKEFSDSENSEKKSCNFMKYKENSINSMNFNHNNISNQYFGPFNQNSMNSNMFFSQKTAMFGIFDKPFVNSQNSQVFTSINYENNWFNEKRQSKLLSSPKKEKKKVKKLLCNKKIVPFWASDMNEVKKKIIEQRNTNTNAIFGEFIIENLDLGMIFDSTFGIWNQGNRSKFLFLFCFLISFFLFLLEEAQQIGKTIKQHRTLSRRSRVFCKKV